MADANRTLLSYKKESTFAVAPTGNYQELRHTGETLGQDTSSVRSAEIRADRQTPDIIRTDIGAAGGFGVELSFGTFDDLLASFLFDSAWSSSVPLADTGVVAAAADNSITASGEDFVTSFGAAAAGMWVAIKGFTNPANNGIFKIVSVATTKLVLSGGTLVNETSGGIVDIVLMSQIVNGTTQDSYTFERDQQDISDRYSVLKGLTPGSMDWTAAAKAIVTGNFSFNGKLETSSGSAVKSGLTAASVTPILNGVDNVYRVYDSMGALLDVAKVNFNTNNNLRMRNVVGTLGPESIGAGTFEAKGSLEIYYKNKALMDKYLAFSQSGLAIVFNEPGALTTIGSGGVYVFEFPAIRYTSGKRNSGGINTDIMATMAFEAFRHPTELVTMRIARLTAADI